MEKDDFLKKVNLALDIFYENDLTLIDIEVNERAICHKFAIYLSELFRRFDVDCEYDKHGDDHKILENISECSEQKKTDRILPDILIHKRGNDKNNLAIFEVKSKSDANACDLKKLELMTNKNKEFKYNFGVFIKFETTREEVKQRLFIDGREYAKP